MDESQTQQREAPATAPFLIHDPEKVWLVQSGSLDLFLVPTHDGKPAGARHHVMRTTPGHLVFGFHLPEFTNMRLLAAPAVESCVRELSRAMLTGQRGAPAEVADVAEAVDDWLIHLCHAAVEKTAPREFEFLEPGTISPPNRTTMLPRQGVLWVRCVGGAARFLGDEDCTLTEGSPPFPIPMSGWLEPEKQTSIHATPTSEIIFDNALWEGLCRFHEAAFRRLIRNLDNAHAKELSRLERRRHSEGVRLDTALRQLASPLSGAEATRVLEEADDDAWLLACAAIGERINIPFKQHPERRKTRDSGDPVTAIANASGVRVRTVALRDRWWRQDSGPLLARREGDRQPVALLPTSLHSYVIYDPVTQTRVAINPKTANTLEPFAWSFYRPFPQKKLKAVDLLRFGLENSRNDLLKILFMGAACGLIATLQPVLTSIMFDSVIPGANRSQLLQIFILMLVAAASTALFEIAQGFCMLRLEGKMDASIQAAVWDRLLSLPVPFFRDYSAGDLANRSLSVSHMREVVTGSVLSSVFSGIFSLFSFGLLFYYSWRLALLATVLTMASVGVTVAAGYLNVRRQRESMKVQGHLSGLLLQFINGISKLRISGTETRAFAAWAREFTNQKKISIRSRKVTIALSVFTAAFPVLCLAAIFWGMSVSMAQAATERLSTGAFLGFSAAFTQFQLASLTLASALISLLEVVPLYERAKPILDELPEVNQTQSYPGDLTGKIEVKHLSFRYRPDTPLVLRNVSIKAAAGQFIAIVGASGSGKSTLLRILLGFETPESGSVYFDNQDLAHLDVQAVRQQMGVVLQSGRILGDFIYKNIIGVAPLTIEHAWEAARMAGLESDIKAMPMGMYTLISEGGGGLSGGQRQRLMIARAIVKKPRIILFDEATSALDNETQAIVSRSLESLQATRIVIAHRLSTIANADYIYVMDKGEVIQQGTYKELIHVQGPFAELARRQIV